MPTSLCNTAGVSTPVTMQVPVGFKALVKTMRWLVLAAVTLCVLVAGSTSPRANMIRDAEIEAGLETLVQPLALAAGYAPGEITVRVVINPKYNAFVAGKRTIYVHSGLILQADDVLEFLGVMAHEIGHIKAGHVPRLDEAQQQASGAAALATIAAMAIAAGGSGDAAAGVLIGGSDRANRVFLSSVRRNESVADEIGLALMDKAALSSVGLRNVMQRMARQRALPESRQSIYYSTHPASAERLQALQDHVNLSPHSANAPSSDMTRLYARMISKMFAWTENPQRVLNKNGGTNARADDRRYALAIASYRQGDLRSALDHMEYLLSAYPDDPFFHEFHGDILFALARPGDAAAAPVVKKERVKVDFTTDIASKALIESIAPVMDDFKIENLLEVLPQIIMHVQTFKNLTGLQKKNMIVAMLRHLVDITDGPGDDELWDPIVKRLLPGMVDMLVKVDQGKLKLNTNPCKSVLGIFSCCRP